jgi:Icc-related predicted phosphoesterase
MRIAFWCMTDTHGGALSLVTGPELVAVLHAGDFYHDDDLNRRARAGQPLSADENASLAEYRDSVQNWIERCAVPVYAVRGNHDAGDLWGFFERCHDITGRLEEVAPGLFVAGIGWHGRTCSDLPGEGELQPVCDGLRRQILRRLGTQDRLIILSHYPQAAMGIREQGAGTYGYKCIRDLVAESLPVAFVWGHIHAAFGEQQVLTWEKGQTKTLNPGRKGCLLVVDLPTGIATVEEAAWPKEESGDGS